MDAIGTTMLLMAITAPLVIPVIITIIIVIISCVLASNNNKRTNEAIQEAHLKSIDMSIMKEILSRKSDAELAAMFELLKKEDKPN